MTDSDDIPDDLKAAQALTNSLQQAYESMDLPDLSDAAESLNEAIQPVKAAEVEAAKTIGDLSIGISDAEDDTDD